MKLFTCILILMILITSFVQAKEVFPGRVSCMISSLDMRGESKFYMHKMRIERVDESHVRVSFLDFKYKVVKVIDGLRLASVEARSETYEKGKLKLEIYLNPRFFDVREAVLAGRDSSGSRVLVLTRGCAGS